MLLRTVVGLDFEHEHSSQKRHLCSLHILTGQAECCKSVESFQVTIMKLILPVITRPGYRCSRWPPLILIRAACPAHTVLE